MAASSLSETRVLLLRHAETSAPDLFHGAESDIGIGAAGFIQARRVAERLAAIGIDAVYSSGMRRAEETARVIAEACGLTLKTCAKLHERKMGPMSGIPRHEGWPVYEEAKSRWIAGETSFTHEGGESFDVMLARAVPALRELLENERGLTVVVVAHGVINRVLLAAVIDEYSHADFDRIPIDFVGVHDLRWDGKTLRLVDYWPGDPTPPLRPNSPRP